MIPYGDYPDLARIKRALVIKLRHHGDVLLTTPVFSALRHALPQASIDAYIYRDTLPMLEGHPAIGSYLLYDREWKSLSLPARIAHELSLLNQIRRAGYDLVINLTEGDRGAIAAWASGAHCRLGWDPQGQGLALKGGMYTHIVKRPKLPRHMVEQNLDAVRRMGVFPSPEERELHFHIPEAATAAVARHLEQAGIRPGGFVLIHPTSRWLFKCWPVERVAELARALHARGHAIVFTAAPDQRELAMLDQILRLCPGLSLLNLGGKLTLKELGALIAASRCLVCVDSVPLHLASALKTPAVGLFGPSSDTTWGPWLNPGGRVVAQPVSCRPCNLDGCGGGKVADCLATLTLATVLENVIHLLGAHNEPH